jgi:hypothetical protein
MTLGSDPNLVPLFRRGMSQRLLMVLPPSIKSSFATCKGLTIQGFLAALYKASQLRSHPFFSTTELSDKLVQGRSSVDFSARAIAPATNPGDPARMLMSRMDQRLVDLVVRKNSIRLFF